MSDSPTPEDDSSVRELSTTSSIGRRGQRKMDTAEWIPIDRVAGLPPVAPAAKAPPKRRVFGLGVVLTLLALNIILLCAALGALYWGTTTQNAAETTKTIVKGVSADYDASRRALAEALVDPDSVIVPLTPTSNLHNATPDVTLIMNRSQHSPPYLLAMRGMPELASDRSYQLWIVRPPNVQPTSDDPLTISSGPFKLDKTGTTLLSFSGPNDLDMYATVFVTEEGVDGSIGPTGPHLLEARIDKAVPLRPTK